MGTSAYIVPELMPAARNVMEYGFIQKGENVLIMADPLIPEPIVQSLVLACEERGAEAIVAMTRPFGTEWRKGAEPPRNLKNAVYASDVVIQLKSTETQIFPRMQETAMIEHDVRMVKIPVATSIETFLSEFALFPYEVMHLVTRKVYEQWIRGATTPGCKPKTVKVKASNGTDLVAKYDPRYVIHTGFLLPKLMPGQWNQFCGATVGIEYFLEADGVICFDGLHGEEEYKMFPPLGSDHVYPLSEPVRWVFKNRYCTIEGGKEAQVMKDIIARGGQYATILCEIAVGINPKAPVLHMPTRHAGVTHYAIGSTRGRTPMPDAEDAPVHTHGHVFKASLWIDDELCIDEGRLLALDDPEVRRAAEKYGDPDEILKEVPY